MGVAAVAARKDAAAIWALDIVDGWNASRVVKEDTGHVTRRSRSWPRPAPVDAASERGGKHHPLASQPVPPSAGSAVPFSSR